MSEVKRLAKNVNIGVCDVFFYPQGQSIPVALGLSKGGITVTYTAEYHEITTDQTGNMPLDDILIGETIQAEGDILDTSLAKIKALMPTATAEGSDDNPQAVTFGSRPGLRTIDCSGKFVFKPIAANQDGSRDLTIHNGANTGGLELSFKLDDEWKIHVNIKGYYDDTKPDGDRLFRIGQEGHYSGEVYKRVIKFWITPANPVKSVGSDVEFKANAMFEDGSTDDVTTRCLWASSDAEIVSMSANRASALKRGSAVIRAEYIGYGNSTSMIVE